MDRSPGDAPEKAGVPGPDGVPSAAYLAAFGCATGAMALTTLDGRVLRANDAFTTRWQRAAEHGALPVPAELAVPDPAKLAVADPAELAVPDPAEAVGRIHLDATLHGTTQLLLRPDGSPGWWLVSLDPPPAPDTLRDPLTGLANRRLLLERVAHALSRRPEARGAVELVVLDVDDFKAINDRFGHVMGDRILVEVAARLSTCVRPADLVARWGGDEFVLLIEDGPEVGGQHVCARIEAAMAVEIVIAGTVLQIGVSCGWVEAEADDDAVGLLHRADLTMYRVKRGRKESAAEADRSNGKARDEELMIRLARARERASELAVVSTDVQARARLALDVIRRRRGEPSRGD